MFENSGDSAASAAFVDLLPRSVLPLVAAAKLVRYPVYQETQQDYQLEQQQQQDCDLVRWLGAAILLLRFSQCCFLQNVVACFCCCCFYFKALEVLTLQCLLLFLLCRVWRVPQRSTRPA